MKKSLLVLLLFCFNLMVYGQKISEKFDQELSIKLDKGTLYGSLLVPKSKNKVPVVLIIPGSGPTDRNCNSSVGLTSNTFMYLAEDLYKKKIATLRIDKRVSGKSAETFGDNLLSVSFNDFIADTEKWIELLQKDERFSEVIVAGHSQGSLVGMVAAKNKKADKFISLAGAGRSIDSILYDQLAPQMPQQADSIRLFIDVLKNGGYMNEAPLVLKQVFSIMMKDFWSEWMEHNPAELLGQMSDIPALIINGEHDIQVAVSEAEILHKAQPKSKLVIIPEMSHILKNAPKERLDNFSTYNQPKLPLNKQLVKEIVFFVLN